MTDTYKNTTINTQISKPSFNIGLSQINFHVGHIEFNLDKILSAIEYHSKQGSDIVVFSELAICGYSPEDLLLRKDFNKQIQNALAVISKKTKSLGIAVLIGYPELIDVNADSPTIIPQERKLYNCACFIDSGEIQEIYRKRDLPNYGVFDEKRYFMPGEKTCVFKYKEHQIGILICEDLWSDTYITETVNDGAEIILSLHGSPFYLNKALHREKMVSNYASKLHVPIVYVNQIGGQDDLIFDGSSFVVSSTGTTMLSLPAFEESNQQIASHLLFNQKSHTSKQLDTNHSNTIRGLCDKELKSLYQALVLATKDYVHKNGFKGIVLGLSGGIDSALTLAIACDALGKEACHAVMMPFRYTSEISILDAKEEAELLGVEFDVVSIEPIFDSFMGVLSPVFKSDKKDTTEENLQARCRGVILMALSNKTNRLVLTTSNKSEVAVGYSTLYGDMAGGFNVLKDLPKTWVYALSEYRNQLGYVIPTRVITRAPSAELAPDQVDQDSLPPYEVLDPLLKAYVESDCSINDLIAQGFKLEDIKRVVRLVNINQYKRAQAPIGPKLTVRSFARERRYPVTNGFNPFSEIYRN